MAEQNFTGLDWEDVRIFVALARYGSLSAAARALSLTHATVSRRMRSLEAVLGEALVERRPDGYVLTSAGTHFLVPANEMEAAAAKLIRGGPDNTPKGLVRVNAPPPQSYAEFSGYAARTTCRIASIAGHQYDNRLAQRESGAARNRYRIEV